MFFEAFFLHTSFAWGGAIGEAISFWLSNFLGEVGLYALLLLIVMIFMIWSINPSFKIGKLDNMPWSGLKQKFALAGVSAATGKAPKTTSSDGLQPKTLRPSHYSNPENNQIKPEPQDDASFDKFGQLEFVIPEEDKKKRAKPMEPVGSPDLEVNIPASADGPNLEIGEDRTDKPLEIEKETPKDHIDLSQPFDPTDELAKFEPPSLELLQGYEDQKVEIDRAELEANKDQIISTLLNYKIEITKIRATIGPDCNPL